MAARLINPDGTEVKNKLCKISGTFQPVKKQYERVNGIFVPVYYDGYILYNRLTTDGSAWVDLGHVGDSTHRYELDFSFDKIDDTNYYGIFGDRASYTSREIFAIRTTSGIVAFGMRNGQSTYLAVPQSEHNRVWCSISSTKYEARNNGNYSTLPNQIDSNFVTPHNLAAFKLISDAYPPLLNLSFYSIKEYGADGTLLYEYVPAKRQSDNVLGLLEVVNGTFHVNAGSGAFSIS